MSQASLPRALRIMDAAIKKWEEQGGRVWLDPKSTQGRTRFGIGQDAVNVAMTEETERIDDGSNERRYWADCKRRHTGRLSLEISGRWADGLRRKWADGKRQRLENVVGSFLQGLKKWLEHEMQSRLDHECEDRQRRRVKEVREERKQRQEQMEQRRNGMETCAKNWRKARETREYLAALESTIENNTLRPSDPGQFPEWLSWAKWYADYIDPLAPTPRRDEYVKPPTNLKIPDLDLTRRVRSVIQLLGVEDTDGLAAVDRKTVDVASDRYEWSTWSEIGRVLEGLGYDVSNREHSYF